MEVGAQNHAYVALLPPPGERLGAHFVYEVVWAPGPPWTGAENIAFPEI